MVHSGIRFNDCIFSEPIHLSAWTPPKYAGLYVILANDANWAPKPYQPLYFGEFGNNTREALLPGDCAGLSGGEKGASLLISVLPLPFSTTQQRWTLRNELIWAYNPASQAQQVPAAAGRSALPVEQVEQKPRNRIGFLP